ncbi:MAG TPA: phospho-sugar mutase, partial [Deltaproteobacteria bacterium]|nr:phospho-sugar mutase [Deltaproteobacteria bacterium]
MSDVLADAEALIDQVQVPDEIRRASLEHLSGWLRLPRYAAYRPQIEALIEAGRGEELVDAFRQVLPFGTGGRRGRVGVGPNRLNPHTVATSVQGHVRWLRQRFGGGAVRVVLAYDVRRFDDVGGLYDAARPSPIHGLSSRDLAELAARIYAAGGIEAHILARGGGWLSTPELSFTIRALGAQGGLNVSASHNPPDDNGVKVYEERGAQLVPPDDEALLNLVAEVVEVDLIDWDEAVTQGRIQFLEPTIRRAYLDTVAGVAGAAG